MFELQPQSGSCADIIGRMLAATVPAQGLRPFILGICGAQGSGKSTVCAQLEQLLAASGLRVATLSLDDLYIGREERETLAQTVHPLWRTRGVPGTHDVALGIGVIEALRAGGTTALPRFDKATDTPLPRDSWSTITPPLDVLLFEGWCVGARPQPVEALAEPVNALERDEDPEALWRTGANRALAGEYRRLFGLLDRLVLLAAPGFEVVARWRSEQEAGLRRRLAAENRPPSLAMTDLEIARFVQHYERLTRHILAEMPARADVTIRLDPDRRVVGVTERRTPADSMP